MVVPAMAQPKESCECAFGPQKGQWEFTLNIGQNQFFNDAAGLYYLLPSEDGTAVGIGVNANTLDVNGGLGNDHISADLATYVLDLSSLSSSRMSVGVNAKVFFTDRLALSFGGAYNVNIQPGKDYVEGESTAIGQINQKDIDVSDIAGKVEIGDIYGQKAILGAASHSAIANLGLDFYFKVRNPRINPYLGILGQFKIARIGSYYPYTGQTVRSDIDTPDLQYDEADLYRSNRVGQVLGIVGGLNAGVDFDITQNVIIGIQCAPVVYQYSLVHLQVMGQDGYFAMNHNIGVFRYPQLKFGFRF